MKQNIHFFTLAVALLVISSIVLTGCMHAFTADKNNSKPYDPVEQPGTPSGNGADENVPMAQTTLQARFAPYLHEDGTAVTVFSEEQYAALLSVRESDRREPLTSEEILFLISDSISLYFSYDEIRLTNANRDSISPLLSEQSGNARVIRPGYRSADDFDTYSEAAQAYNTMLSDIYEIIYYRIYMHDAGFETVYHTVQSGDDIIFGNRFHGEYGQINSAVPQGVYQILAVDESASGGVENEEKLCTEYETLLWQERIFSMDSAFASSMFPQLGCTVLYTDIVIRNTADQPMEHQFHMAGPKDEPPQQVYPTVELESMRPRQWADYHTSFETNALQPGFRLNYTTGTFALSAGIVFDAVWSGTYKEEDGVLKLYLDEYSYVFYRQEDGYAFDAENSNPAPIDMALTDGCLFEFVADDRTVLKDNRDSS